VNPYNEYRKNNIIVREFDGDVDNQELVWHRDRNDRTIIPMKCEGWQFQYDNKPPFKMVPHQAFKVKAEEYHRIIKGTGKLVLKIIEG
jgi:hypothetical protein